MIVSPRTSHARRLFDGIAASYEWPAELFSFGQYGRWRRAAVRRLDVRPGDLVLDVATGTGLVARDARRLKSARVIGVDQSLEMLAQARRTGVPLVGVSALALPFRDTVFDGLTFSYLLRYVDDPVAAIEEMVRVLKPGGSMVSIEFGRPSGRATGPLWNLYAMHVFRAAARVISPGWAEVGGFLGASIAAFNAAWPPERIAGLWRSAGMSEVRFRSMSLGGGVVMWGRRA